MSPRLARPLAAALLALPIVTGCASVRGDAPPTARLDAADVERLDRADVACYHGVTFR